MSQLTSKQNLVEVLPNGQQSESIYLDYYPKKILQGFIKLNNKQNIIVAYKLRTNDPKHLSLKPNLGYIQPKGSVVLQLQLQDVFQDVTQQVKQKLELQVIAIEGQNSQAPIDVAEIFTKKTSETPIQSQKIQIFLKDPEQNTDINTNTIINNSLEQQNSRSKSGSQEIQTGFLKESVYTVKSGHNSTVPDISIFKQNSQQQQEIFQSTYNKIQLEKSQSQAENQQENLQTIQENQQKQKKYSEDEDENENLNPKQKYEKLKSQLNYNKTQISHYQSQISDLEKSINIKNSQFKSNQKEIDILQSEKKKGYSVVTYILIIILLLLGVYLGTYLSNIINPTGIKHEQEI